MDLERCLQQIVLYLGELGMSRESGRLISYTTCCKALSLEVTSFGFELFKKAIAHS
jgi:hypothetical protein